MQAFGNDHDEQKAPPEDRHREAGDGEPHQGLIEDAAAFDRRDDARRHTKDDGKQHSGKR